MGELHDDGREFMGISASNDGIWGPCKPIKMDMLAKKTVELFLEVILFSHYSATMYTRLPN